MKSFPVYQAVPRGDRQSLVHTMVFQGKGTKTSEIAFCGETVRKFSGRNGLEVTRVLFEMAQSKDLTILCVAFMNTPLPEGDPVYVEPPEGLYETTRCGV